MNPTPTLQIKLPRLFKEQREIIQHPARFKVLACGRRFSKTTIIVDQLINDMLSGYPVAYSAPSYKMVQDVWRILKRILTPVISYSNETERRIELITGGTLDMWSLESPDSIRGRKYYRVAIDEAAFIRNLKSIWERALTPLLTDLRGMALFASTPQGYNDFYQLYQYGILGVEGWKSFQYPTSANPFIPKDEIELQRRTLPPRSFGQEYEAVFEEDAGAIYDTFSQDNVSVLADYNPDLPVVWGIDDGYVFGEGKGTASYHPRVFLLAQYTANGGLNIFAEYIACGELSEVSIANVRAMGYPDPDVAYIDSSAAELKGRLWSAGIQTFGATHKVDEGIKNVRRLVRDGQNVCLLLIHPRCPDTIDEMQKYRMDMQRNPPVPLKIDDHCPSTIRYLANPLRYN